MDSNGYLIRGRFIPQEILTIILGHVLPHESIMQCRMVCKNWKHIIETESWRYVVELRKNQQTPYTEAEVGKISKMPWYILHAMCAENSIFGKNFVLSFSDNPIWSLADPKSSNWKIVPTDNVKASIDEDEVLSSADYFSFRMRGDAATSRTSQVIEFPKCGLFNLIYAVLRPKISSSF